MKAIATVLKHTFWLGYGQSFGHQDCPGSGEKPSCFRNWLRCQLTKIIVNSIYSGHCRDLELVSSLARVRNSVKHLFLTAELAAARIIGVSVIAGCPQGES